MSRVSQTVFRFTSRHGFDGLQSFQEPIPSPGLGEVLVKVRGIGLNYRDIAIAYSQYPFAVKDSGKHVSPQCLFAHLILSKGACDKEVLTLDNNSNSLCRHGGHCHGDWPTFRKFKRQPCDSYPSNFSRGWRLCDSDFESNWPC
ncbi:hypothetical protein GGR57DRAFT_199637 [Xylariaceae sp. FL1272]|nr:hypothetical protein GGR57DRAFT_199637 [Xylariaceae sp. FL1272]